MKKNIATIAFVFIAFSFSAQTGNVGIATATANTTLDVNATTNVNNEINLAGTNSSQGNSGTAGDLISGNGTVNPVWKNFDLPSGYLDGMILSANFLRSTTTGVSFVGAGGAGTPYNPPIALAAPWAEVTGVQVPVFNITKSTNTVNIFVQTVAQVTGTTGNGSFGCGIFIDDSMVYARTGIVTGTSGSYKMLNINATIPNLSVGSHSFKFACAQRNVANTNTLDIGQANGSVTTLSPTMAGTSASIKIIEQGN